LIKAMNVNTVRLFIDPGPNATGRAVLDQLYSNGIMVIMTVDDGINDMNRVRDVVNFYKDHPAILMWTLGSEWNINRYFGVASSVLNAAQRTQNAAVLIKTLDTNHPVAASYGEIDINADGLRLPDTQNYVNNICTSVDVWGLNIYRGNTFGTLFNQWEAITTKPMFIGEFGTDAFRTTSYPPLTCPVSGVVDEAAQASWDLNLWNHLFQNLSARDASKVAIGGAVFEWNDEWWKVSPAGSQQNCGHNQNLGGHPDQIANEEYFGIVDILRQPRQVYNKLQTAFDLAAQSSITFRAVSEGAYAGGCAEFFKNGVRIWRGCGGSGGFRGFNIMAVNPSTGEHLIDPSNNLPIRSFDTWETRLLCSTTGPKDKKTEMIEYLNSIPNGFLILLAVADEAGLTEFDMPEENRCTKLSDPCTERLLQTLENLGSTEVRKYCYRDSWAMTAYKGEGFARDEQWKSGRGNPPQPASVSISFDPAQTPPPTQIEIFPTSPNTFDNILIKLSGEWPNTCTPQAPQKEPNGNQIRLATSNLGQNCGQIPTRWSHIVGMGQLTAGIYDITVTFAGLPPSQPITLAQRRFTVTARNCSGTNLVELLRPSPIITNVSSTYRGYAKERAIDGNLNTSWFADTGDAVNRGRTPFYELTFPRDVTVTCIAMRGNREFKDGYDFLAGEFFGYNAANLIINMTGKVNLPAPSRDVDLPGLNWSNVRRVRFEGREDEGPGPGFAEIAIYGTADYEADAAPRPIGDMRLSATDWVQTGLFIAGLPKPEIGSEFQRADCAPKETKGDGRLTVADWVQAGRYIATLDSLMPAGGPTAPSSFAVVVNQVGYSSAANFEEKRALRLVNLAAGEFGIFLNSMGNENALGFSLNFDPAQSRFISARLTSEFRHITMLLNRNEVDHGRVGLMLALPTGQTLPVGTRHLVTARYAAISSTTTNPVFFADQPVAREVVGTDANPLPANYILEQVTSGARILSLVSAASFGGAELTSESIVAAFGAGLATTTQAATSLPLPTTLAGTRVLVRDSAGVERDAPLFFVAPAQVNYLIPAGTAAGVATVVITSGDGKVSTGVVQIATVAPGLFSANASEQGVASGVALRVKADGAQTFEPIARFDQAQNRFVAVPIDLGPATDQVFLILYGTGFRNRSALAAMACKIGGADAEVLFAGAAPGFVGLDQSNVRLPRSLAGRGDVEIRLSVDGKASNAPMIRVK
jgi:uncharacterized protein (TIGR03437 family)